MSNPKPAPFNVVPNDTTGTTWALPEGAIARLGKGVYRSGPDLDSIALSPCGKIIAVRAYGEILLWCTERLTTLNTILHPEKKELRYVLAFSPCGRYLASGT